MMLRRFVVLIAMLLPLGTAQAAQRQQFDLRCTGPASSITGSQKLNGPLTRVLHVDLVAKQYCVDACETVVPIASVDPVRIIFLAVDNKGGALNMFKGNETVDRRTGEYEMSILDAANLKFLSTKGKCEPQPFTPFPQTKF